MGAVAALSRDYTSIFAPTEFAEDVVGLIIGEFAAEPHGKDRVMDQLANLISRRGISPKLA